MKVIILAGGFGTRLSEETDIKPKPMVEIGGKPILWHIMKIYSSHGFNNFVILPDTIVTPSLRDTVLSLLCLRIVLVLTLISRLRSVARSRARRPWVSRLSASRPLHLGEREIIVHGIVHTAIARKRLRGNGAEKQYLCHS